MKKIYIKPLIEVIYAACQKSILGGSWNDHADSKQNNDFFDEDMEDDELELVHRDVWND
ncbi:hypothetical protein [Prevotella sp. OH937_COT-195]|uniref:hypothetical protein n=1 Tax=Prevotella sp. OH937_COT-195 TaxID=2491051 RepID=UPI001315080B|nr:hypothetical protein [Prevotella sp. OH937_COT-195]